MKTTTQNTSILAALLKGQRITPLIALQKWGCMRLASRIFNLRSQGHNIKSETVTRSGTHFSCYFLSK